MRLGWLFRLVRIVRSFPGSFLVPLGAGAGGAPHSSGVESEVWGLRQRTVGVGGAGPSVLSISRRYQPLCA